MRILDSHEDTHLVDIRGGFKSPTTERADNSEGRLLSDALHLGHLGQKVCSEETSRAVLKSESVK
jgi:hypothetical protein